MPNAVILILWIRAFYTLHSVSKGGELRGPGVPRGPRTPAPVAQQGVKAGGRLHQRWSQGSVPVLDTSTGANIVTDFSACEQVHLPAPLYAGSGGWGRPPLTPLGQDARRDRQCGQLSCEDPKTVREVLAVAHGDALWKRCVNTVRGMF